MSPRIIGHDSSGHARNRHENPKHEAMSGMLQNLGS
jgi:hypothetical protein